MKRTLLFPLVLIAAPALAQPSVAGTPGTFTNEEQVYFDGEAGYTPPPWTGVRIETKGGARAWHTIDRFGTALASETIVATDTGWTIGSCALAAERGADGATSFLPAANGCSGRAIPVRLDSQGLTLRLADGQQTSLKRARQFTCWMSVKRTAPKPDGNEDWLFKSNMTTHDQGGRLRLGGGNSGAPEAIIRIRNVVWPQPTRNRPSLVLYVFTPDDTHRAVAYGWADPGAVRVGINQRWMQASCTLDGAE
ncbi:hypothetical protein BSY18_3076 [Blastomonas sp. RAC04]|uniref:hypothetical protein n=1 Tax=Blastomonas sp. RAC04 TaxID=1842535 RepID=UPI00083D5315|nr:hypothetical protein [Blastomonas sp. RAC04]AOF99448.1 hypothetical protein BSY18_3076 [Blastomonas sp. RAC04]